MYYSCALTSQHLERPWDCHTFDFYRLPWHARYQDVIGPLLTRFGFSMIKKSTENASISQSLPQFSFTQSTKKPAKGLDPSRVYYNLLLSETHYYIVRAVYRPIPSHPIPLALWDHFIIIQRCSETPSIKWMIWKSRAGLWCVTRVTGH